MIGVGFALAPIAVRGRAAATAPAAAIRNNQSGYVRNASGGYVFRSYS